ncbi:MAG: hypothetical protein WC503_00280 [Candidatus Shapirobacteria bacterium]
MIESCLKINKEYPWFPGIRQDFSIVLEDERTVGSLSITRFTITEPFETRWTYLNSIQIPDLENRGQSFASQAMREVNKLIKLEDRNGILKNSIIERNKRDFYRHQGWTKVGGVGTQWEFLLNQPLSVFLMRQTISVVKENFVR